ncbi:transcriptional regulator [uncultured Sphingomonas sp.]|uniref:transcriptional regulator n=1 Tax=uncultured Sphingomonas sp. TaxID=158754 RepID=UPI00345C0372
MDKLEKPPLSLREIVEQAGSLTRVAEICGCTVSNVSQLLSRGSDLPARHVLAVEVALGIPRSSIRPDLYPKDLAG